jgi:hypothetical protein
LKQDGDEHSVEGNGLSSASVVFGALSDVVLDQEGDLSEFSVESTVLATYFHDAWQFTGNSDERVATTTPNSTVLVWVLPPETTHIEIQNAAFETEDDHHYFVALNFLASSGIWWGIFIGRDRGRVRRSENRCR